MVPDGCLGRYSGLTWLCTLMGQSDIGPGIASHIPNGGISKAHSISIHDLARKQGGVRYLSNSLDKACYLILIMIGLVVIH